MNTKQKLFYVAVGAGTLLMLLASFLYGTFSKGDIVATSTPEEFVGANSFPDTQWINVKSFDGYQTKLDPSKVSDGANPNGQNTTIFEGDRIGVRALGYSLYPSGTSTTTEDKINSIHTFRKRDGENILMRTYSTYIEYYDETGDTWERLMTGMTDGLTYGFADYNINTDLQSRVYFGNQTDSAYYWSGAHSTLVGNLAAASTTVFVSDITEFLNSGSVMICGTSIAYSSLTVASNRINLTGTAGITCTASRDVAQAPVAQTGIPKGNIYMVAQNRLFVAGIASTSQAIYFSKYGDASTFTSASLVTESTADAAGIFNLGEGGGPVIGMVQDESSLYFLKRSIIYKATLSDSLYTLDALKPFDGKGQTVGGVTSKSIFTGGNAVYFITPDNQLMGLLRVDAVDYPQTNPISNIIKPTVDVMNFNDAAGIVFQDKAYFAMKSNKTVTQNDTVLVYNINVGKWDSPIIGWNVSDFTIYDDGNGEDLYFGSNLIPEVYVVNNTSADDIYDVTANWRSKQFDFGTPGQLKQVTDMYVDGYIAPNTTITISLLLDEDGYTQRFSTTLTGTDSTYIFNSSSYNTFGLTPFGTERFGSNEDLSGKKRFRVYLGKDFRANPFYTAQVDFASDGDNQSWEVLNFGLKVRPYSVEANRNLYKSFQ